MYPEQNVSFARASSAYAALLRDPRTFQAMTLEHALRAPLLSDESRAGFEARYLAR